MISARDMEQSFGVQKTDGQFVIVAWGPHGDRDATISWPGPCTRISRGSSAASQSVCSSSAPGRTVRTWVCVTLC